MADSSVSFNTDRLQSQFTVSPLLHRLLTLQNIASTTLETLSDDRQHLLRTYYAYAMVWRRNVVADVPTHVWKFDLACSLAAVLFARERIQGHQCSSATLQTLIRDLLAALYADVVEPWFVFALRNARRPTMIAMPSLPAVDLGMDEERFYVQSVSDTWPSKTVSTLEGDVLKISSEASRRFVDNVVAGDLGGVELFLSEPEKSFVQDHSIGWVSRYETLSRTVTIIEVDPFAQGELSVERHAILAGYALVNVEEQRLDMYALNKKMHEDDSFRENFVLSRLLTIDQSLSPIPETSQAIDVRTYIHVKGSINDGLGPVDEEVFLKSLGSMTAKNKVRSALSISAKARLLHLRDRSGIIRDVLANETPTVNSRMIRCSVDGIYVRTKVPFDSVLVFVLVGTFAVSAARILISVEGVRSFGEAFALAVAITLGFSLTYHNLRYKSWPLNETVRLRRMCKSDEEMYHNMSELEAICTIAEAGANGAQMDGILTCPFSDSKLGRFSVTQPLQLEIASKVGMKLRLSTSLKPLWLDFKGLRAATQDPVRRVWHAYGPYLNVSYLDLTASGPQVIGG